MEQINNVGKSKDFIVNAKQKKILDYRRKTSKPEDFIPWNEAKKTLIFR